MSRWFDDEELNKAFEKRKIGDALADNERIIVSLGGAGTLKSRLAYSFLSAAFPKGAESSVSDAESCNGAPGVILLSSEGIKKEMLDEIMSECGVDTEKYSDQILVRAVRPRFLSSSNFVFRIKLCIREMKRLLLEQCDKKSPFFNYVDDDFDATRIRLVIDNWNSIVDAHAPLKKDPQLLHSVAALLREEGILAYFVGTQPGSPNETHAVQRVHNLATLEATRIHTWPVDFFGDRRIAITSSLPGSYDRRTKIYELVRIDKDGESENLRHRVKVNTQFDFYRDLESGHPKRVDLEVKLYSGYHEGNDLEIGDTQKYNHEVSALFGDLFPSSQNGDDVVAFENIERYDAFKDYIQNLDNAHLSKTLVFQVDEFWVAEGEKGPFADLQGYWESKGDKNDFDPDFPRDNTTRVPLHKDFGLILANRDAWWKAKDIPIGSLKWGWYEDLGIICNGYASPLLTLRYPSSKRASKICSELSQSSDWPSSKWEAAQRPLMVGDVWNALCVSEDAKFKMKRIRKGTGRENIHLQPPWELFLDACRTVAIRCGKSAFDVDLRTSESLNSLVLEIWRSKVQDFYFMYSYLQDDDRFRDPKQQKLNQSRGDSIKLLLENQLSLAEMVKKFECDLDYAIRLLAGYVPDRYREYDLQLSPPSPNAVAFRTWFAPAVLCQSENRNLTPLRLPGRFSTRGDWHLGVARGSRSMLLAHSAIEKLVSKSMNRKRLRDGIGLPVCSTDPNVESALTIPDPSTSSHKRLSYGEVMRIEPKAMPKYGDDENAVSGDDWEPSLTQLYRSRIKNYNASSNELFLMFASLLRDVDPLTREAIGKGPNTTPSDTCKLAFKQFIETSDVTSI